MSIKTVADAAGVSADCIVGSARAGTNVHLIGRGRDSEIPPTVRYIVTTVFFRLIT